MPVSMSTFKAALRGTSWALVAQIVIGLGQIAYSALTARVFNPKAFGECAAALSLHALIVLCAGTSLSSFVLKESGINRTQLRAISVAVLSMAVLGGVLFWFVSPVWLSWLNSPGGSQFVPLLTLATIAAPIGAVQSALLRREGNGFVDAMVYIAAFVMANAAAAICVVVSREPWSLALGTAINPLILIVLSRVMRRAAYPIEHKPLTFEWFTFASRVAGQNLLFFGLGQVPTWALGAKTDPAILGQFSRGNILAHLPAYALSTAITRGTQPHWRRVHSKESRIRAVSEALLLAASMSFVGFTTLAVLSRPLTNLWLGPGWDLAAHFTAWLAIGFAMHVPTVLLANYLEMSGSLSRLHWIQLANAAGLAPGVALLVWLHDFRFLLAGFVLSHLLGLLTAVIQVSSAMETRAARLLKQLIYPLVSAIASGAAACGAAAFVAVATNGNTVLAYAAELCGGSLAVIALLVITRKWHPAFAILVARGVIRPPN